MKRNYRHKNKFRFKNCKNGYSRFKDKVETMSSNRGIYRSRKSILMGVCRGFADFFNLNVFWVRAITIILFLFTGFWPIGVIYITAGLLLKVEPVSPLHSEKEEEFYDSYTRSRQSAIQRIKRKFENIERRIQRMEHTVTSREFNWK